MRVPHTMSTFNRVWTYIILKLPIKKHKRRIIGLHRACKADLQVHNIESFKTL